MSGLPGLPLNSQPSSAAFENHIFNWPMKTWLAYLWIANDLFIGNLQITPTRDCCYHFLYPLAPLLSLYLKPLPLLSQLLIPFSSKASGTPVNNGTKSKHVMPGSTSWVSNLSSHTGLHSEGSHACLMLCCYWLKTLHNCF